MPYVITITGPSRCGKSRVIDILKEMDNNKSFQPVVIQKYTTRAFRKNEIEFVKSNKQNELDILPVVGEYNFIEAETKDGLEDIKLKAFNDLGCDLVYEQYGSRYGIKLKDIFELVKSGKSPIVILNDIRTVEDVRNIFGKQCKSLFIFRETPNIETYTSQGEERKEDKKTVRARFEKATAIYRIYIENIHIFDKLILNVKNGDDSLRIIIESFVKMLTTRNRLFR